MGVKKQKRSPPTVENSIEQVSLNHLSFQISFQFVSVTVQTSRRGTSSFNTTLVETKNVEIQMVSENSLSESFWDIIAHTLCCLGQQTVDR